MNSSYSQLTLNLLPPTKLICDLKHWSYLFSQDIQILWEKSHGIPLNRLPSEVLDLVYPYLLLAISDYKSTQSNKMNGIKINSLLNLWFEKYLLNREGYFELIN